MKKYLPIAAEWGFGFVLFLIGTYYTFSSEELTGFFYLLAAALFLPPLYNTCETFFHLKFSQKFKIILTTIFLLIAVISSLRIITINRNVLHPKPTSVPLFPNLK